MPRRQQLAVASGVLGALDDLVPPGRLSRALLLLIAVLLFFETIAYGAVEAWSELTALLISGLIIVVLLLRHVLDQGSRGPATWLWAPLGLFAGLAVLQAVPLPADWAAWLSPGTLYRKQEFLGLGELETSSLSYYPRETWRLLRMMLVGGALFASAITLGREPGGVRRLLTLVFLVGCGEAVFAVAQIVAQADWAYEAAGRAPRPIVTAGTFLNYSNFSQFVNLSIGAGLGLLLVRTERRRRTTGKPASWDDFWRTEGWIVAGLAACSLSIFTSMSRNGVLSMMVAGGCFLVLLQRRRSSSAQAWALVAVPVVVFVGLCIVGFDLVYDRLGSLSESRYFIDRWQLTLDTLRAWQDHPYLGIGLNAHEYVFTAYDTTGGLAIAQTADNDYAQLLEETGVVGVSFVAAALLLVAWMIRSLTRSRASSTSMAAFGIAYALVAVAVHSWSDFGQRIPAVFSLTSILVGVLVAAVSRAIADRGSGYGDSGSSRRIRRAQGAIAAALLLPLWGVALAVGYIASQAEESWAEAYYQEQVIAEKDWLASIDEYRFLLASAESAAALDSNNVRYAYRLNLYRWQAMLWAGGASDPPDTGAPEFIKVTSAVVDALSRTRELCPTFGPPYTLEGQLRYFVLRDTAEGRRQIILAAELAPQDPTSLYNAGLLHAQEQNIELAYPLFVRLIELQESYFSEVAEQLVVTLRSPESAEQLCGDSPKRLEALARLYEEQGGQLSARADGLRQLAMTELQSRVDAGEATSQELARVAEAAREQGDADRAIQLLRKALAEDYSNIPLRLRLATWLSESGQHDQALHQAQICRRLKPGDKLAKQLVEEFYDRSRASGASAD